MTSPLKYPQPPVELAGAVEAYLYDCTPADGCGVCAALVRELEEAKAAKKWGAAYDAAAEVRNHPHAKRASAGDSGMARRLGARPERVE